MSTSKSGIPATPTAFSERLERALGPAPQAVVAKRAGISTSTFSAYLSGESEPSVSRAARVAKVLGVNLLWLATGEGDPHLQGGYTHIPIYDVQLAAGTAAFVDAARIVGSMPFDLDLMLDVANRSSATNLGVLQVDGDSMEPLISDNGRVLVDFSDTRLREGIFAFRLGDELRLKRLRRALNGVEIISENPRYQPELLQEDRLGDFAVLGRAIWSGSRL